MLSTILDFGRRESGAIKKGILSSKIGALEVKKSISMIKWTREEDVEPQVREIKENMTKQFDGLLVEVNG
jgi:V/A-type H+-transporting ATPase subunit A